MLDEQLQIHTAHPKCSSKCRLAVTQSVEEDWPLNPLPTCTALKLLDTVTGQPSSHHKELLPLERGRNHHKP